MILRQALSYVAALAAIAAAALVCVVAAAFAVYALALPRLGPAGAAAVTAALAAVIVAVIIAVALAQIDANSTIDDAALVDRLVLLARERPLMAASAAGAVLVVVLRNPAVLAVLASMVTGAFSTHREKPPSPGPSGKAEAKSPTQRRAKAKT